MKKMCFTLLDTVKVHISSATAHAGIKAPLCLADLIVKSL